MMSYNDTVRFKFHWRMRIMDKKYEALKLENQLCFPLYAASRDVIKQYKTSLDNLDLTYTQYIVMLVLWERKQITTKEMGRILHLDSGTLTPLLKKMEGKGLVSRKRSEFDERNLTVTITDKGLNLRDEAIEIPNQIAQCNVLDEAETETLYKLLYKIMDAAK
jgi:DNA-binding MarR family transcriptional regulator